MKADRVWLLDEQAFFSDKRIASVQVGKERVAEIEVEGQWVWVTEAGGARSIGIHASRVKSIEGAKRGSGAGGK